MSEGVETLTPRQQEIVELVYKIESGLNNLTLAELFSLFRQLRDASTKLEEETEISSEFEKTINELIAKISHTTERRWGIPDMPGFVHKVEQEIIDRNLSGNEIENLVDRLATPSATKSKPEERTPLTREAVLSMSNEDLNKLYGALLDVKAKKVIDDEEAQALAWVNAERRERELRGSIKGLDIEAPDESEEDHNEDAMNPELYSLYDEMVLLARNARKEMLAGDNTKTGLVMGLEKLDDILVSEDQVKALNEFILHTPEYNGTGNGRILRSLAERFLKLIAGDKKSRVWPPKDDPFVDAEQLIFVPGKKIRAKFNKTASAPIGHPLGVPGTRQVDSDKLEAEYAASEARRKERLARLAWVMTQDSVDSPDLQKKFGINNSEAMSFLEYAELNGIIDRSGKGGRFKVIKRTEVNTASPMSKEELDSIYISIENKYRDIKFQVAKLLSLIGNVDKYRTFNYRFIELAMNSHASRMYNFEQEHGKEALGNEYKSIHQKFIELEKDMQEAIDEATKESEKGKPIFLKSLRIEGETEDKRIPIHKLSDNELINVEKHLAEQIAGWAKSAGAPIVGKKDKEGDLANVRAEIDKRKEARPKDGASGKIYGGVSGTWSSEARDTGEGATGGTTGGTTGMERPETSETSTGEIRAGISMEDVETGETPTGRFAFITNEGYDYKANEDALVFDILGERSFFGVIDGMGGHADGATAARILAEELLEGSIRGREYEDIQRRAAERMPVDERRGDAGKSGAVYAGLDIEGNKLKVVQAGDARVIVVREGKVVFQTKDEGPDLWDIRHHVKNAVEAGNPGETIRSEIFELEKGDIVLAGTDGVFDNFDHRVMVKGTGGVDVAMRDPKLGNEEIAILFDKPRAEGPKLIAHQLQMLLLERMKRSDNKDSTYKKDNFSFVIYQHGKSEVTPKKEPEADEPGFDDKTFDLSSVWDKFTLDEEPEATKATKGKKDSGELPETGLPEYFEKEARMKEFESMEEFKALSEGQKWLALQNLDQIMLGQVEERTEEEYAKSVSKEAGVSWGSRLWRGLTKNYQLKKKRKEAREEIVNDEAKKTELLKEIIRGIVTNGTEVEKRKDGNFTVNFISNKELHAPTSVLEEFNFAADALGMIPYEWGLDEAGDKENKLYMAALQRYALAENKLRNEAVKPEMGNKPEDIITALIRAEGRVDADRFLTTHPKATKVLLNIPNESIWREALKLTITERGPAFMLGFAAKSVAGALLGVASGFALAPLIAAEMGRRGGRKRAEKELKRKDKLSRRGKGEASDVLGMKTKSAKDLILDLENAMRLGVEIDPIRRQTNVTYIERLLLGEGLVDFGNDKEQLATKIKLAQTLIKAKIDCQTSIVELPDTLKLASSKFANERLDELEHAISSEKTELGAKREEHVRRAGLKAAGWAAGLAIGGAAVRELVGLVYHNYFSGAHPDALATARQDTVIPSATHTTGESVEPVGHAGPGTESETPIPGSHPTPTPEPRLGSAGPNSPEAHTGASGANYPEHTGASTSVGTGTSSGSGARPPIEATHDNGASGGGAGASANGHEGIAHEATIREGGSAWRTAKELVSDKKEFARDWANPESQVKLPDGKYHHISDAWLTHKGDKIVHIDGVGGKAGHFEIQNESHMNLGDKTALQHLRPEHTSSHPIEAGDSHSVEEHLPPTTPDDHINTLDTYRHGHPSGEVPIGKVLKDGQAVEIGAGVERATRHAREHIETLVTPSGHTLSVGERNLVEGYGINLRIYDSLLHAKTKIGDLMKMSSDRTKALMDLQTGKIKLPKGLKVADFGSIMRLSRRIREMIGINTDGGAKIPKKILKMTLEKFLTNQK